MSTAMASGAVVTVNSRELVEQKGTLFENLKVFILQRVPARSSYIDAVRNNGGTIPLQDLHADVVIADHFRKDCPPGSISYTWIDKSIQSGRREPWEEHRAGPPEGQLRPVGSAQPRKLTRNPYTHADDVCLYRWVKRYRDQGGDAWRGNEIYKQLEMTNARHPWQSWRDRYLKYVSVKPPSGIDLNDTADPPSASVAQIPGPQTSTETRQGDEEQGTGVGKTDLANIPIIPGPNENLNDHAQSQDVSRTINGSTQRDLSSQSESGASQRAASRATLLQEFQLPSKTDQNLFISAEEYNEAPTVPISTFDSHGDPNNGEVLQNPSPKRRRVERSESPVIVNVRRIDPSWQPRSLLEKNVAGRKRKSRNRDRVSVKEESPTASQQALFEPGTAWEADPPTTPLYHLEQNIDMTQSPIDSAPTETQQVSDGSNALVAEDDSGSVASFAHADKGTTNTEPVAPITSPGIDDTSNDTTQPSLSQDTGHPGSQPRLQAEPADEGLTVGDAVDSLSQPAGPPATSSTEETGDSVRAAYMPTPQPERSENLISVDSAVVAGESQRTRLRQSSHGSTDFVWNIESRTGSPIETHHETSHDTGVSEDPSWQSNAELNEYGQLIEQAKTTEHEQTTEQDTIHRSGAKAVVAKTVEHQHKTNSQTTIPLYQQGLEAPENRSHKRLKLSTPSKHPRHARDSLALESELVVSSFSKEERDRLMLSASEIGNVPYHRVNEMWRDFAESEHGMGHSAAEWKAFYEQEILSAAVADGSEEAAVNVRVESTPSAQVQRSEPFGPRSTRGQRSELRGSELTESELDPKHAMEREQQYPHVSELRTQDSDQHWEHPDGDEENEDGSPGSYPALQTSAITGRDLSPTAQDNTAFQIFESSDSEEVDQENFDAQLQRPGERPYRETGEALDFISEGTRFRLQPAAINQPDNEYDRQHHEDTKEAIGLEAPVYESSPLREDNPITATLRKAAAASSVGMSLGTVLSPSRSQLSQQGADGTRRDDDSFVQFDIASPEAVESQSRLGSSPERARHKYHPRGSPSPTPVNVDSESDDDDAFEPVPARDIRTRDNRAASQDNYPIDFDVPAPPPDSSPLSSTVAAREHSDSSIAVHDFAQPSQSTGSVLNPAPPASKMRKRSLPWTDREEFQHTQALFDGETQRPDFDLPGPPRTPSSVTSGNAREIQDTDNESNPDDIVSRFLENYQKRGFGKEEIYYAMEHASFDEDLTDMVLESLRQGKGIPRNVPGIWTEEDEAALKAGDAAALRQLELLHGKQYFDQAYAAINPGAYEFDDDD